MKRAAAHVCPREAPPLPASHHGLDQVSTQQGGTQSWWAQGWIKDHSQGSHSRTCGPLLTSPLLPCVHKSRRIGWAHETGDLVHPAHETFFLSRLEYPDGHSPWGRHGGPGSSKAEMCSAPCGVGLAPHIPVGVGIPSEPSSRGIR